MLNGIHFLLTYTCNFECDHCFLYCSPFSSGTFTIEQISHVLEEAQKTGTVEWVYYEGGEPFLYYPVLIEAIKRARKMDFQVGVVTNAYGAISEADAELWLRPMAEAGLSYLNVSDDALHYGEEKNNPAATAAIVAKSLGIATDAICIEKPMVETTAGEGKEKGQPVVGGNAMFRGRAVDKLAAGLPVRPWKELRECPYEDLAAPSRVHVDPYGNVHLCQGLSMGNMWKTPLSKLVAGYTAESHPIAGPLVRGGPRRLAEELGLEHEAAYIDECHFCYELRRSIVDDYPGYIGPRQVYGLDDE